ncbi:MAG: hypothetical protein JWM88_244 [Verrucomicrobia bacterium]|nr:hypothetical protein [Verrucomicrobiota bacterium]
MKRVAAVLLAAAVAAAARSADWRPDISLVARWNSNAANADRAADEIGALELQASAEVFATRIALGRDDALFLSAGVALDAWPRFDQLGSIGAGPRLSWQHKFGLGALAPVLRVEFTADAVDARNEERSGLAGSGRALWQRRFESGLQLTLSYERTRRHARDALYNQTAGEAAAGISYDLGELWTLAVKTSWRRGDVLSYAIPPRPDLVALARDRDTVDTFGQPRVAYSLEARSLGGAVAVTRSIDDRTALTWGYEYRVTERSPLRYRNHLVSAGVSRQF